MTLWLSSFKLSGCTILLQDRKNLRNEFFSAVNLFGHFHRLPHRQVSTKQRSVILLSRPSEPCSHLKGFFQIQRELLFPHFLLMRFIEARHIELAVILHLQGITAREQLYSAVQRRKALCQFLRFCMIPVVEYLPRRVHRQNDAHIHLACEVI